MSHSNLKQVLLQANQSDWALGRHSWTRYNKILKDLSQMHGFALSTACGVFSALSPNNDYHGNLRDTATVLAAVKKGLDPAAYKVTTYHTNKRKAHRIATGGDPEQLIVAPKTRNFYFNLLDPYDKRPVTIDGHIYNAWTGTRINLNTAAVRFKVSLYETIADDIRALAEEQDHDTPNVIQATIWHCWKRLHNIRYEQQIPLWANDVMICGLGFAPEVDYAAR